MVAELPAVQNTQNTFMQDLGRSGIIPDDLDAYLAGPSELAACNVRLYSDNELTSPGYVIPYYGIDGKRVPFYRMRVFNPLPGRAKYLQPGDTAAYIYYPKQFHQQLKLLEQGNLPRAKINGHTPAILIVEGEKKAAKAAKEGFLCVGLGGVYNWRSRTISLPEDTRIIKDPQSGVFTIKVSSNTGTLDGDDSIEARINNKWAIGFTELLQVISKFDMHVVIAFDNDHPVKPQVQQAAATLGFELRSYGLPLNRIRQLILPPNGVSKVAPDDFLVEFGAQRFENEIHKVLDQRTAFPQYPNMREYVNRLLSSPIQRNEAKDISTAILADIDTNGTRLKDKDTGEPYYFDSRTKQLMRVSLMRYAHEPLHESTFGRFLYKNYDISQADSKLLPWLASAFTGEEPIYDVRPHSVFTVLDNGNIALQLGDAHYVVISGDPDKPFTFHDNGDNGVLFRGDMVEEVDINLLKRHITHQLPQTFKPWWLDVLKEFKFIRENDVSLATLLFYISPWLLRWNGTQLPVELMIGEPGSGKSTMYMLRMMIMTGRPALRNQPSDVRDWYSSVTSTAGLHVTDNVHFVSKEIKQRLSDEICRIVTEPDPFIELRKLYTTTDNLRVPVRNVFALTAIQQPFTNADIIQRAAIFELNAVGGNHDSNWLKRHLDSKGGREAWMAHHIVFLHLFLKKGIHEKLWNPVYRSHHRLVNYEQCLSLASIVTGMGDAQIVTKQFMRATEEQVSEYDWTMDAIKEFVNYALPHLQKDLSKSFTCKHISDWAAGHDDYKDNTNVSTARRLSRYFAAHKTMIEKVTGIYETGKKNNVMCYRAQPVEKL